MFRPTNISVLKHKMLLLLFWCTVVILAITSNAQQQLRRHHHPLLDELIPDFGFPSPSKHAELATLNEEACGLNTAALLCRSALHGNRCCPLGKSGRMDVCCNENPASSACATNGKCEPLTRAPSVCAAKDPVLCRSKEFGMRCCPKGDGGRTNVCCNTNPPSTACARAGTCQVIVQNDHPEFLFVSAMMMVVIAAWIVWALVGSRQPATKEVSIETASLQPS